MRVLVVGAGGAGGYFGARWARAGLDVTLLARGVHLKKIRTSGLTLRAADDYTRVEVPATDDPSAVGDVDVVVFATKTWQLVEAAAAVAPHVPDSAAVFGVQNGVEAADVLAGAFPSGSVLGATCRIISFVEEPGVIRHLGLPPVITVGETGGGPSERVEAIRSALDLGAVLRVEASTDVELAIWRKFLFFAPISGVGSVTRSPIGEVRTRAESRELLQAAVDEVYAVGRARAVPFPEEAPAETMMFIDGLPADGTSSMQRDLEADRPSELEALAGAVVRMGKEAGVPTPAHDFIYAELAPREARARGRPGPA